MAYDDTGQNVSESLDTLKAQQAQLLAGKRHVQMFPRGTRELPLPACLKRHENSRGVFHFRPSKIGVDTIERLSVEGRENEFLNLGPYNKSDIAARMVRGEQLLAIAEFNPDGIEMRAAAGTTSTLPEQLTYFERTKDAGNTVSVCNFPHLMMRRMAA